MINRQLATLDMSLVLSKTKINRWEGVKRE